MKKLLGIALLALFAVFGCGKKTAEEVPRVKKAGIKPGSGLAKQHFMLHCKTETHAS